MGAQLAHKIIHFFLNEKKISLSLMALVNTLLTLGTLGLKPKLRATNAFRKQANKLNIIIVPLVVSVDCHKLSNIN